MKRVYKQGFYTPLNLNKCQNTRPLNFKSKLELKLMGYFDRTPNVVKWSYESVLIPYISPLDGCGHTYHTDFIIHVDSGDDNRYTAIVEAKASCFVPTTNNFAIIKKRRNTPSKSKMLNELIVNKAKFDSAEEYCKKRGWRFVVITEKDVS